jgi:hypothetical protein
VIGVGSLLARSTGSSVRQAQDDPERSRMGQGPELVEGQAIHTSKSSFARPTEDRSRASFPPTICIDTAKARMAYTSGKQRGAFERMVDRCRSRLTEPL